ncbi:MAG TPA: LysR family transcriptional regulator [Haliangium sp.]|nr:LysR family transcriptional regulator [Haliangium sp.]
MHIYGIDANLLVSLDALLRETSVTRAARRMGLTQSAMSHALARLRDHLADPLLVRAGRQMVLTPKAEALAPRVARLVEEMSRLFSPGEGFEPASLTRAFSLRTTDHILFVLMPEIDALLNAEAPGVDLLVSSLSEEGVDALRHGQCDLAVGVFSDLPSDIREQALFTDRFVCLVRKEHPVARTGLSLSQYGAIPHVLVAPRGSPVGIVDRQLAEHGIRRRVARSVPHFLVAPFLVMHSDAVVTMSERMAQRISPLLDLAVLEPPLTLPHYTLTMAWHERHDNDPAHRWLRDVLVRAASRLPALERRERSEGERRRAPMRRRSKTRPDATTRSGQAT